ncbi:signal peptidase I [Streptomyces bomunensis]|uniref:Signal peptidase I n=1 Tax=Streptomyces montanisoli TaxID=2798581 RepID=A0A940M8K2_9ACTN|nr:signal peptidase I [Streptomyces montanisoli]MBP0456272.1 signal peptidase I [Streptomyces montanisoli]
MGRRGRPPGHGGAGAAGDGTYALRGRADRRRLARRVKRRRRRSAVTEIPLLILVALVIALLLKTFLVQAFVIPSGSMENTIRIGDRVLVDKLTPWFGAEPSRGDVVVFKDPNDWLAGEKQAPDTSPPVVKQIKEALTFIGLLPSADDRDLIKRVVGVGGDTVKCCNKDGKVTVNGKPLDEPYLYPGNAPSTMPFEVKVPKGRLFFLGDHRAVSADSRFHLHEEFRGTVPLSDVVGRAVVIAWPVGHWRKLDEPATFRGVPGPGGTHALATGESPTVAYRDRNGLPAPPGPAELPLVMGVVALSRPWDRRPHGVDSRPVGPYTVNSDPTDSHEVKEWMWGMWRSAHGPGTRVPRRAASRSPRRPKP